MPDFLGLPRTPFLDEETRSDEISCTIAPGAPARRISALPLVRCRIVGILSESEHDGLVVAQLKVRRSGQLGEDLLVMDGFQSARDFHIKKKTPMGLRAYPVLEAGDSVEMLVSARGRGGDTFSGRFYLVVSYEQG